MNLCNKIKEWWHKRTYKVCPICKREVHEANFAYMWLSGGCDTCFWINHHMALAKAKEFEKEARINEMTEAIRRSQPIKIKPGHITGGGPG